MEPAVPLALVLRRAACGAWPLRPLARRLTIVAGALLVAVVLLAADAVKSFVRGVLLAYLLGPFVDRLAALWIPRGLAALILSIAIQLLQNNVRVSSLARESCPG